MSTMVPSYSWPLVPTPTSWLCCLLGVTTRGWPVGRQGEQGEVVGCTMGELRREQSTGCAEERREVESREAQESIERAVKDVEMELVLSRDLFSQELMAGTAGQLGQALGIWNQPLGCLSFHGV